MLKHLKKEKEKRFNRPEIQLIRKGSL